MQIVFEDALKWSRVYQRNNKKKGLKTLRCFPYCSDVHSNKGYCGRPVNVRVEMQNFNPEEISFCAEFGRVDQPRDINLGSIVTADELEINMRSRKDPSNRYYMGEVMNVRNEYRGTSAMQQVASFDVEFNRRKMGWHYTWTGNKHLAHAEHALFVYALIKLDCDTFRCIHVSMSPPFLMYSRKRNDKIDETREPGTAQSESDKDEDDTQTQAIPDLVIYGTENASSDPSSFHGTLNQSGSVCTDGYRSSTYSGDELYPSNYQPEDEIESFRRFFLDTFWQDEAEATLSGHLKRERGESAPLVDEYGSRIDTEPIPFQSTHDWHEETDIDDSELNDRLWNLVIVFSLVEAYLADQFGSGPSLSEGSKDEITVSDNSKTNLMMVKQLTNFLMNEESFTLSIAETMSSLRSNATAKEKKSAFVDVAHAQIDVFCRDVNMNMDDFTIIFEQHKSISLLKQAALRLGMLNEIVSSYMQAGMSSEVQGEAGSSFGKRSKSVETPFDTNLPVNWNISGYWKMNDELLNAHETMRQLRGVPVVLRKMVRHIEASLLLEQSDNKTIRMQGNRKLLSNGGNLYICDGKMRKFNLSSPLPWSRPLAESYRGMLHPNEPICILEHYYSDTERLVRTIRYDNGRLHFKLSLQRFLTGYTDWSVVDEKCGYADLIMPIPGFHVN